MAGGQDGICWHGIMVEQEGGMAGGHGEGSLLKMQESPHILSEPQLDEVDGKKKLFLWKEKK